jgi:ABC-type uncharacterized transport system ATPase subunit
VSSSGPSDAGSQPERGAIAELRAITKRFGRTVACNDVGLELTAGQVHGLLGENGAGKSTLMRILAGFLVPDDGTVSIEGRPLRLGDAHHASALGVVMMHQDDSLIGALSVWENLELTSEHRPDRSAVVRDLRDIRAQYGLDVDPDAVIGTMAPSQRQRVELAKCLRRRPRILVMDEPTASLTPAESQSLFRVLRQLAVESGLAIVLISHRLEEIMRATDDVTVMRRGRIVNRWLTKDTSAEALAEAMVGRVVDLKAEAAAVGVAPASGDGVAAAIADRPMLRLIAVEARSTLSGEALREVTLDVAAGEIVGVVGVEGNGQRALAELLSGHLRTSAGIVEIDGARLDQHRHDSLRRAGVSVIPEDRFRDGCAPSLTVAENLVLDQLVGPDASPFINRRALHRLAVRRAGAYGVGGASLDAPMAALSGGNQQRVVLARELSRGPKVLLAAQPTRGLDVGAIEDVYRRLADAARTGIAVILISSDLDEVLTLSHRVVVLFDGRVVADGAPITLGPRQLGMLMTTGAA